MFAKQGAIVFHSDKRRNHKVMEEQYGKRPKPVLGSDCYNTYNPLDAVKQRCWSPLLDDSSDLEEEEGESFHESLKELYSETKLRDIGPPLVRELSVRYCEGRLWGLIDRDWSDPEAEKVAKMAKKHRGERFNFIGCKEVEPTNNLAERALRPEVVFRKIIGDYRSWNGAKKHDILRSILTTCKLRDKNFIDFLEKQYKKLVTS